jgi:hypothetical protein
MSFSALSQKSNFGRRRTSQSSVLFHLCINGSNLPCFAPTRGRPIFCERPRLPFQPLSCTAQAWMTLLTPSWQPPLITFSPRFTSDVDAPRYSSALQQIRTWHQTGWLWAHWRRFAGLSLQPCMQQSVHSPSGFTRSHTCLSETCTGYLTIIQLDTRSSSATSMSAWTRSCSV